MGETTNALIFLSTVLAISGVCVGQTGRDLEYGENCANDDQCNAANKLACIDGICNCDDDHFNATNDGNCTSLSSQVELKWKRNVHDLILTVDAQDADARIQIQRIKCPRNLSDACNFSGVILHPPKKIKATIKGLQPATLYRMTVSLIDKRSNKRFSMPSEQYTMPAKPRDFTEHVLAPGHAQINWTQEGDPEKLLIKCTWCGVGLSCKSHTTTESASCERNDLEEFVRYKVDVTVWKKRNDSATAEHTLRYVRFPDVATVTDTSIGLTSINLTLVESAERPVGQYVINVSSSDRPDSCFYFQRNETCEMPQAASNCKRGDIIYPTSPDATDGSSSTSVSTTVTASTNIDSQISSTDSINNNNSNSRNTSNTTSSRKKRDTGSGLAGDNRDKVEMQLVVTGLSPATDYQLSLVPWFCGFNSSGGKPISLNMTTRSPGSVSVSQINGKHVSVAWSALDLVDPNVPVNYTVWLKDALKDLQVPRFCNTVRTARHRHRLCSTNRTGNDNGTCSGYAPYAFWEYELQVTATVEGEEVDYEPVSLVTGSGEPGQVRNLRSEECSTQREDKVCIAWSEMCPRDRNGFIREYEFRVYNKDQEVLSNRSTSRLQHDDATMYRRDTTNQQYNFTFVATPGDRYRFEVWAVNLNNKPGAEAHTTVTIPVTEKPRVPRENEIGKLVPEEEITAGKDTIQFRITNQTFLSDTSRGRLDDRGMIVVPDSKNDDHFYSDDASRYKGNLPSWHTYQRHEEPQSPGYKVPFTEEDLRNGGTVTLGDNKPDCGSLKYCDGELQPDTVYSVWVYVCNAKGCADVRVVDKKRTKPAKGQQEVLTPAVIALLVLGVMAWVAIGVLAYFLCFRKTRRRRPVSEWDSGSGGMFPLRPRNTKPMVLVNLETTIAKKQRDECLLLREEYDEIKACDVNYPIDTSLMDINRPKNRFADIMTFDHTRVKISPDEQGSDYINANYVPGYTRDDEYIATQGPLHSTMNDFWRMVWEHRVPIIVMLTQTVERGQIKCEKYWPSEHGEDRQYGEIMVTATSVSSLNDYNITIFSLRHEKEDEEHEVIHFHYLKWLDMTADVQLQTILNFVSFVRQHVRPDRSGPMIVHCSAGVGRTGTFISIDYVMQFINERPVTDQLDIYGLILRMRTYRCRMVQTDSQYILIHQCARHLMSARRRRDMENRSGKSHPPPLQLANGSSQALLLGTHDDETAVDAVEYATEDPAVAHGSESESAHDVTESDTIEMDPAQDDAPMAQGTAEEATAVDTSGETEEEEEVPANLPIATSSMEQLFVP